ncbi:MAG: hypothetical protein HC875_23010 [Anaerolineales bacterium]|nr:hypothetical protein [Anaerolineales bacterium]
MIISHTHRYVFVQLPHAGSTAIGTELVENYEGVTILHKHAHYLEFLRIASADEKKYFVFSSIRNPLDEAVSIYTHFKTNPYQIFTNPKKLKKMAAGLTATPPISTNGSPRFSLIFPPFQTILQAALR